MKEKKKEKKKESNKTKKIYIWKGYIAIGFLYISKSLLNTTKLEWGFFFLFHLCTNYTSHFYKWEGIGRYNGSGGKEDDRK
jgi:hypothetical protein